LLTFKMKLISELSKLDSTFKSFLKKDLDVSAEELKLDDITNLQPDSDLQTCNTMKDFTKIMNNISAEHQTKLDFNIESNNDDDE